MFMGSFLVLLFCIVSSHAPTVLDYVTEVISCSLPNVQIWHQVFEFGQKQNKEHQRVSLSEISTAGCTTCLARQTCQRTPEDKVPASQDASVQQYWACSQGKLRNQFQTQQMLEIKAT